MLAVDSILQGRYRVLRPIEQGGMGTVYEALDLRLLTSVALKEAHVTGERLRRQFEREARMLAHLRHPAMTKVFDHFTEGDGQFLVMEYVPGEDLAEMMRNRGRAFHPLEVVAWAEQILDVLEYLHTREPSVVHRDIKPSNLKLTDRGQIILLDFGLARGGAQGADAESIIGFTPHYAPLEQIQGTGTSTSSDLYSLGATLYHLLTNEKPPDALTRVTEVIGSRPDPLTPASHLNEHVTKELAAVLTQALALDAHARPGSAAEMRRLLREASATLSEVTVEQAGDSLLPSQKAQLNYWTQFRDFLTNRNSSLRTEAPRPQNYLGVWADRNFFRLAAFAHADIRQVGVSLSLNGPKAQARFNRLLEVKEAVESELGYGLRWDDHQHISRYEVWVALEDTDPTDPAAWPRQYEWLAGKLEGVLRVFTQRFTALTADELAAAESPAPPRPAAGEERPPGLPTSPLDPLARPEPAPVASGPSAPENVSGHPPGPHQNRLGRPLPGHVEGKSSSRASKWVLIISAAAVVLFSTTLAFMLLGGRRAGLTGGAQLQPTARPVRDALINIADIKVTGELERPDSSAQLTPNSFIYLLAKINSKGRARVRGRLLVDRVAGGRQGAGVPGADTTVELLKSGTATFKFASATGWRRGSYTAEVTLFGERDDLKDVRSVSFVIP